MFSVGVQAGCDGGVSACGQLDSMLTGSPMVEDMTVTSAGLVARMERILGVNTGDRLKVVIPRSGQSEAGIGVVIGNYFI